MDIVCICDSIAKWFKPFFFIYSCLYLSFSHFLFDFCLFFFRWFIRLPFSSSQLTNIQIFIFFASLQTTKTNERKNRTFNKFRFESGATDTAWCSTHTGPAIQKLGQKWFACVECGTGNLADFFAGSARRTVWSDHQIGLRQRHQYVWHFRSTFRLVGKITFLFFPKRTWMIGFSLSPSHFERRIGAG